MPKTRVKIYHYGRIEVEGIDYVGDQCLRDFEKLLSRLRELGVDISVVSQVLKPEATAKTRTRTELVIHEG